mgnify:CR=1 FL=1
MKDNHSIVEWIKFGVIAAFLVFTVYSNAKKVPEIESKVQNLEVRQSVSEAHYVDIMKTLERIERRLK